MSDAALHRQLVEQWYEALETLDLKGFTEVHHPECVYNISGHTPISGQVRLDALLKEVLPLVFGALDLDRFRFCTRRKIVCSDAHRIVGVMEADGSAVNGARYDQRYVHMFAFRDARIGTVWEYFDTALANGALFAGLSREVAGVDPAGFEL